jgi:RNA polymerase sigma factor (sigma-70 family)
MINLTAQQIADAKNKDLDAITAVIKETEERVGQLARHYATTSGRTDHTLMEDLMQTGRIAVWEALDRFQGTEVAQFFTFIDKTLKGVLSDERKEEQRIGVSRSVAADFEKALRIADGDPYLAEFLVTTTEVMGKRKMSEDTAYAARLSWMGIEYLDRPVTTGHNDKPADCKSLGETIADTLGVPEDLLEPSDYVSAERKKTTDKVQYVLKKMGAQHRHVLSALTGIAPVGYYGTENDAELAEELGVQQYRVTSIRSRAKDRFAELWIAAFGA